MPSVQPFSFVSAPRRPASVRGSVNRTLVWAFTLACVVVLLPVLLVDTVRKPPAHAATETAWLEFVSPEFATIVFNEAPDPEISFGLIRPASSADEAGNSTFSTDEEPSEPSPPPVGDPLRWLDGRVPPLRSPVGPNHLQYKLDPDFGFENRNLRLNGMMIRLWVEF